MKPLVSILIPAYNAEEWIAETIASALAQTWQCKEIILIDDGSTDRTAEIARSFAPKVTVLSTENQGLSAAVNLAFRLSHGDYIQELDADDLMLPDKIERQLAALADGDSKRLLLSSPWAHFYYRTRHARFISTSLCQDLSPVEWLLRKMSENLHMQNATWLTSRELWEAAGPWDEKLHYDQDGEYFDRVVVASEGIRFVPGTGIFYRVSGKTRISYIGKSNKKKDSLFRSMKLHVQYLQSLEESERVRNTCLVYLQNWYGAFYPDREDLAGEMQKLAGELHGHLEKPSLRSKYAWMEPIIGLERAKWAQNEIPQIKAAWLRQWDKAIHSMELRHPPRAMRQDNKSSQGS
jgi:glycosyltransferase involved in cell wall biosynthesis